MIKKFIIKGVSKKFKGLQKLKPQKTPSRFTKVLSDTQVRSNQRKVLGDIPEVMGLSSRSIGDLASDSLILKTANKTFFKSLKTELKRSRSRTATGIKSIKKFRPVSKLAVKRTKNKGAIQSLERATAKEKTVSNQTSEFLKGRFSTSFGSKISKRPLRDGTKLRREGDRIIEYQKKLMKDMGF